ncbi:LysR family transcriptional regulator [Photobacterium kasasachensis]|uniref:LysR family transcriptional regulator n=1 Tax=Photobacterium kasasachensis TaxID=2910240 RepID=UPI003D13E87D
MKTEDIKLFHQIVDAGSLIRAAEIFDLPKSNLSRRVKALEEELQVQLFHRHNRSMQLTEAGETFYERTKALISDFELCIQEVTAPTYELSGHLRVQVLPLPGVIDIGRAIFKFMDLYPKVTVEIITSSIETDLIENHIDVALRIGDKLEDSTLIARPFMSASFGYYATEKYIEANGMPQTPEDMANHNMIRFRYPNGHLYNKMPLGQDKVIEGAGNLIMNSAPLMMEACLQHRGIIFIPETLADFYIERGMLVRLFEDIEPSMSYGWLVYPSRKYLSVTVRTFIDYMMTEAENLGVCQNIEGDIRGMSI